MGKTIVSPRGSGKGFDDHSVTGEDLGSTDFPDLDTPADRIREALLPLRVSDDVVEKLIDLFHQDTQAIPASHSIIQERIDIIEKLLYPLRMQQSLATWYGMQFAIRSKLTETVSPAEVCRVLGVNREFLSYHVKKMRRLLGIPKDADLRKHSIKLSWRERQRVKAAGKRDYPLRSR